MALQPIPLNTVLGQRDAPLRWGSSENRLNGADSAQRLEYIAGVIARVWDALSNHEVYIQECVAERRG